MHCSSEFHGVFADRRQDGPDPFASDLWLAFCRDLALQMSLDKTRDPFRSATLRRLKHSLRPSRWPRVVGALAQGNIPDFETPNYLAPLVDEIRSTIGQKGHCRVIDIGGGWGDNFLLVGRALSGLLNRLHYTVVDNPRVTALGRELYSRCQNAPKLMSDVPFGEKFDLVVLCGTIQYVDDWRDFLSMSKSIGDAVYITRTPVISGEGFYTQQTVFVDGVDAGTYPIRVFGRGELMASMHDWRLALESRTEDYSEPLASLPGKIAAAYYAHLWRR